MESGWWKRLRSWVNPTLDINMSGVALLEAAMRGDLPVVQQLLATNTPPDEVRSRLKETALWHAATGGHTEMVEALLNAGADPGLEDKTGASPLTQAAAGGYVEMIQLMAKARPEAFQSKSAALALRRATLNAHSRAVRALLVGGVPPNARVRGFPSPLLAAAITDPGSVAELLAAGADTDARDADGRTALHWAVWAEEHASIRLLMSHQANPLATDNNGRTPIQEASTDHVRHLMQPLVPANALPVPIPPAGSGPVVLPCSHVLPGPRRNAS